MRVTGKAWHDWFWTLLVELNIVLGVYREENARNLVISMGHVMLSKYFRRKMYELFFVEKLYKGHAIAFCGKK